MGGRDSFPRRYRGRLMEDVLGKRLLFVTGKGGVGKSTVAAALGAARRPPRAAHDARRGRRPGPRRTRARWAARRLRGAHARTGPVHDLDRSRARAGGVPARAAAGARDGRIAGLEPHVPVLRRGHAGDARAAHDGQGVGARAARAAHRGRGSVRSGDRRRAGHRARSGRAARAGHLRPGRARGADRTPGRDHRARDRRPPPHRRRRRHPGGGDAGLRDAVAARRAAQGARAAARADRRQRGAPRPLLAPPGVLDPPRAARAPTPAARAALRAALSGHARARGQREQLQRLRKGLRSEPVELPFVVSVNGERTMLERLADALEATRAVKAAA